MQNDTATYDGYDYLHRPFQEAGDVPRDASGRDQFGRKAPFRR